MKKLLLIILSVLFITACSEQNQFEQVVLEQMQNEQDILDYKIDPELIADCVIALTTKDMPGFFPADPRRKPYYLGMSKLIGVAKSDDPEKALQEGRSYFDSPKEALQAMMKYSQHNMECIATLVETNRTG